MFVPALHTEPSVFPIHSMDLDTSKFIIQLRKFNYLQLQSFLPAEKRN